jgi:competence protein ComEA
MPAVTFTRRQAIALFAVALLGVFAAAHFLGSHGGSAAGASAADVPALTTPAATSVSAASPTAPSVLVVDVAGAVRRPGLYRLSQGSRIADAIARAGGATRHADTALVNLAAPLADGEQVLVPSAVGGAAAAAGAAAAPAGAPSPTAPVDLNTATAEQLDALPGVGPVTAQKIVDYRTQHGPFTSVDDLDAIPGIGPARIADLQGLVTT